MTKHECDDVKNDIKKATVIVHQLKLMISPKSFDFEKNRHHMEESLDKLGDLLQIAKEDMHKIEEVIAH